MRCLTATFYPVKFDAEQREDIKVGSKTYSYVGQGRRGYHELAATYTRQWTTELLPNRSLFEDAVDRVEQAIATQ